jgi:glycine betaine/choline ABC-type transport system substrate-binding protein
MRALNTAVDIDHHDAKGVVRQFLEHLALSHSP